MHQTANRRLRIVRRKIRTALMSKHSTPLYRGRGLLLLATVFVLITTSVFVMPRNFANAATSSNLNFQARLQNLNGSSVADGDYNVEFKLYDSASAGASGQGVCSLDSSTDDCVWIETRTGANKVRVVNGYLSVNLASVTAFASTINWDQDMYLTMRVGGTGSPSWDTELTSSGVRMKLTAVPYAFQAQRAEKLDNGTITLEIDDILQRAPAGLQLVNSTVAGLRLNQTGSGGLLQLQGDGADVFTVLKTGDVTSAGSAVFKGASIEVGAASQLGGLILNDGAGKTGTIQTATLGANRTYTLPNASGEICLVTTCSGGGGLSFLQDGNDFGEAAVLGTNDNFSLSFETNDTIQLVLDTAGNLNIVNGNLSTSGTIRLTNAGVLQNVTGDNTNGVSFNANTITSGTLNDLRLSSNVTLQGNSFNGNSQLVQLDGSGKFVALDGSALTNLTAGNLTGQVAVANGGTGLATLTQNGVLFGNGTSAAGVTAAGTTGQCLVATTGLAPSWGSCAGAGSGVSLQSAYNGGNTITTTDAKNLLFSLADTTTDSNFLVDIASGSTSKFAIQSNGTDVLHVSSTGTVIDTGGLSVLAGGALITGNTSVSSGTFTSSGGAISLNASSNFATNINTGTSTGTITLGGGSSPLVIDSTNFDVSSAGALSGITTIATSGPINGQTIANAASFVTSVTAPTINGSTSLQYAGVDINTNTALSNVAYLNRASQTFSGTLTVQGANSLTLGQASTNTGAIVFQGSGGSGTLTVRGPVTPNAGNYTLSIPAITGNANICTDNSICTGYAASSGGTGYIQNQFASAQSANFFIQNAGATTDNTVVIKQSASQTGDLLQLQSSGGAYLAAIQNDGVLNLGPVSGVEQITGTSTLGDKIALYTNATFGRYGFGIQSGTLVAHVGASNAVFAVRVDPGSGAASSAGSNAFAVTGAGVGTFAGTLAVNGNALSSTSGTFTLLNSPTNVSAFGAATTLSIGTSGGTTTINGNTLTNAGLTFGGASGTISTTANGNLTLSPNGSGVLALNTGSSGLLTTNASTIRRTAAGTTIFDLLDGSNTTLSFTNSGVGVLNLTVEGSGTFGTGLTVSSGGALITGNTSVSSGTFTSSGGAISLNVSSNFATNINTGTSTGTITLGGGSSPLVIDSTNFDVSSAGALSGITTINTSGTITGPTINATSGFQHNGTNGRTLDCAATEGIDNVEIRGGILITSDCRGFGLSDSGLKNNIASVSSSVLDNIRDVNVVNFNFDCTNNIFSQNGGKYGCDGSDQTGVVAQELEAIFPELVFTGSDGYKRVRYEGLSMYTLKAVQELATKFDSSGNADFNSVSINGSLKLNSSGQLVNINGLTVSSGGASITGGLTLATGVLNLTSGGITNTGAVAGVTTLGLSGAITGATSGNTINGLIINSGALSGVTTINASGLVNSVGLTAGGGLVQGTGGLTFTGTISLNHNASTNTTNIGTGTTTGLISIGGSGAPLVIDTTNFDFDSTNGLAIVGKANFTTRTYVPGTSGTTGQGYFIGSNTTPLSGFQALDLGGNTYSFFATNKHYNGSAWVDNGLARVGSSFQIQNDAFTFYSFDSGTNFTPRFTVASGGNVGIGLSGAPGALLSVGGTTGNFRVSTTGAITAPTSTNTINGLIINSGSLSGITGFTQASGNFAISGTGTLSTGTGAISLNGAVTAGSTLNVTGLTTLGTGITGAGLTNCNGANNRVTYNSSSQTFGCDTMTTRSFIDSTADTVADNNTTNYWDLAAENGNSYPNLTLSNSSNEIFGIVTMEVTQTGGSGDIEAVSRIVRTTDGSVPTCTSTQVGSNIGTFTTNNGAQSATTINFIDEPATTANPIRYSICSDSATNIQGFGSSAQVSRVRFTFFEVNNTADLAEVYPTNDLTLGPGEVVKLDNGLKNGVARSNKAYQQDVYGVVSTDPAMVIGGTGGLGKNGVAVALTGRVPVKVSTENGSIKKGDILTSSSIPGVAMKATKAGAILGIAMDDYDGQGVGSVMVFVKTGYYNGSNLRDIITQGDPNKSSGRKVLEQLASQNEPNSENVSDIFTDRLAAGLEIISPKVFADSIELNTIKSINEGDIKIILNEGRTLSIQGLGGAAANIDSQGYIDANGIKTSGILRLTNEGSLRDISGLNIVSGGASINGGINNNVGGITNTGVLSGVTSLVAQNITLNNPSSSAIIINKDGKGVFKVLNNGALQLSIGAPNALNIKNSAGLDYFNVNTQDGLISIGSSTVDNQAVLFVLDSKNTAGDPTGVNGASYYNTSTQAFRCYENNVWKDCISETSVSKSTDQTVTNTNLLTSDQDLVFTVVPSSYYTFEATINVSTSSSLAGYKYTFTAPEDAMISVNTNASTGKASSVVCNIVVSAQICEVISPEADFRGVISIKGYVATSTNGGKVQFRFAQYTPLTDHSVKVFKGSTISYRRTQ